MRKVFRPDHGEAPKGGLLPRLDFPGYVRWAHAGAFVLYAAVALLLLRGYRQPAFDLGIYDQTIWLLSQGLDFNTVAGIHVFGAHFSPILYLLTPLALIPGGAIPEILFQSWWLATLPFPLYLLSRHLAVNPRPLVLIGVIHPGVFTAAWFGFHPWTLAAPFLAWTALFLLRSPRWHVLVGLGLMGLTIREDIGFWVGIVAAVLFLARRLALPQLLAGGLPIALASAVIVFGVLPQLSPTDDYLYASAFGAGSSLSLAPAMAASTLARLVYLLLPLGLTIEVARRVNWTAALPLVVPLLGVALRGALSLNFHYEALFVPVLVLVLALSGDLPLSPLSVVSFSLLAALALGTFRPIGPSPGTNPLMVSTSEIQVLDELTMEVQRRDNGRTGLSLPTRLVAHFSEREQIFTFPYPFDRIWPEPYAMNCPPPELVVTDERLLEEHATPNWDSASDRYALEGQFGPFHLYRLNTPRPETPCRVS